LDPESRFFFNRFPKFLKKILLFLIGFLFSLNFVRVSQNMHYLNSLCVLLKLKSDFSFTKEKIKDKMEPLTIDCEFTNDSWI